MTVIPSQYKWMIGLLSFLCIGLNAKAQSDTLLLKDETVYLEGEQIEQMMRKEKHSPHKATFYAAILPGLGQIYNKKYWKLPILYAGIGGAGYAIHFNTKYYKIYKSAYRDWIIQDPGNKSYMDVVPAGWTEEMLQNNSSWFESALESKRQYYRRYRDLSYLLMVGVYIIQIVDATVDAHFYNFSINDDLSMRVEPTMLPSETGYPSAVGLQLNLKF